MEVDYLVIGAGLAGMAFTDSLIEESDATVLMVDRRHGPGGHWNDAYPFVRLHQPSAFYGVNSLNLGEDHIDEQGPNAGFYERATGAEICHYFQTVLEDRLLPSGQVELRPMTTCAATRDGQATLTSLLTGAQHEVTVRRKMVDARYLESSIPSTHTPSFTTDPGVRCIPVNDLVRSEEPAGGYAVLGAGKTGMDACTWLLDNGVDPARISWVKPREPWLTDRASLQPRDRVGSFMIAWAASIEAAGSATSVPDLFARLESCGALARVDTTVEPTMFRAPILSEREREQLRTIERIIRAGRVRQIQSHRLVLEEAEVPMADATLYVDCTAVGLAASPPRRVFEASRITMQQVREGSPSLNAALIGYIEATRDDVTEQNHLTPPSAYPNTSTDWIRMRHIGLVAQQRWDQTPDIAAWLESSRLNLAAGLLGHVGEPGVGDAIGTYLNNTGPAIDNLARLRAELGEVVDL